MTRHTGSTARFPWLSSRVSLPLCGVFLVQAALLGCSETELSGIPKEEEVPPTIVPDVPPPSPATELPPTPPPTEVEPEEPIADAGPSQNVEIGDLVVLDGSQSYDPLGFDPLEFQWTLLSWPTGSSVQVIGLDAEMPNFIADVAGDYSFELTVGNTEGLWDLTPDVVTITAEGAPGLEPIADAGPDQLVAPLDTVVLDGQASTDPQGLTPLTYAWTLVTAPLGSTATLANPGASQPTFFADLAGIYEFDLVVQNSAGVWDATPDRVSIEAVPQDGFYVELSWNTQTDIDLHMLDNGAALWSAGDVNFCNKTPSWGAPGTDDDPSLDWDVIPGYGPETTTVTSPADGTYTVVVHYYGPGANFCLFGCPPAQATVSIYLGGQLAQTFTQTINAPGDIWTVADIHFPDGTITPVNTSGTTSQSICN